MPAVHPSWIVESATVSELARAHGYGVVPLADVYAKSAAAYSERWSVDSNGGSGPSWLSGGVGSRRITSGKKADALRVPRRHARAMSWQRHGEFANSVTISGWYLPQLDSRATAYRQRSLSQLTGDA
jgi:hypothetical protein